VECQHCKSILDPAIIAWTVYYCAELINAESSYGEYLGAFEATCAAYGKDVKAISKADAGAIAKKNLGLKKQLKKLALTSRDWIHLMAAHSAGSEALCSTDPDYWDPANKAIPKAKHKSTRVKTIIEAALPIVIVLPSEALMP
jgi:hypothetical protein